MGWTLSKKLDTFAGPGEIKRREVVLDPQVSPEEIKGSRAGKWSWAQKVGLLLLQVVTRQQCYGHCPCDSAPHSS